jgi:hypothetical protein
MLALALVLVLPACGGQAVKSGDPPQAQETAWKTDAYNALAESKVAYYQAFKALKLAKEAGRLKPEDEARSVKYGNLYREAHNEAVRQLLNNRRPDLFAVKTVLGLFEAVAVPYLTSRKE